MGILNKFVRAIGMEKACKREIVAKALFDIGINLKKCYWDQDGNLIIPDSEIQK